MIEAQRDNIGNALSLLQCLSLAMDAVGVPIEGPFFPAAVQAVVEMLARTVDALDPSNVEQRLTVPQALDA
jgi:hypothetical protein